jgi:CBS domain-containing protein
VDPVAIERARLLTVVDPTRSASVVPATVHQVDGAALVVIVRVNVDVDWHGLDLDVFGFGVSASGRITTRGRKHQAEQAQSTNQACHTGWGSKNHTSRLAGGNGSCTRLRMGTSNRIAHQISLALRDLVAVRDEARLRVHLLSLEGREKLAELEAEITSFERQLSASGDWVAEHVVAGARQLTQALVDLLDGSRKQATTRVRDVMQRDVATCHPWDSLNRAAQLMWEADCGAIPIIDEQDKLVGMLTDRDVCMAAYTRGLPLAELGVQTAMSEHPFSCSPEDPLTALLSLMTTQQIRRVPVVSEGGRLVGIVSLADVARLAQAPSAESSEARSWVPGVLAGISEPKSNNHRPS